MTTSKEINVLRVDVEVFQFVPFLLWNVGWSGVETLDVLRTKGRKLLTVFQIASEEVVPAPLKIPGNQIFSMVRSSWGEKEVGDLFSHVRINPLHGLSGQTNHHVGDAIGVFVVGVIEEFQSERDFSFNVESEWIGQLNHSLQHRVADSEGSRGETVFHGGINIGIVCGSSFSDLQTIFSITTEALAKDDGEPIVVDNVLHLSNVDSSGFLENPFVSHMTKVTGNQFGNAIVLPNPYGVDGSQTRHFPGSGISSAKVSIVANTSSFFRSQDWE